MKKNQEKLVRFGVAMPDGLLEQFDSWVSAGGLPNRSLALRKIVREYISHEYWQKESGLVAGSITLMYDHHSHDTTGDLTALQHDFGDVIVCTTHVHVSHEICLECLIVRGPVEQIKKLAAALSAMKGMKSVDSAITAMI